MSNKTRVTTTFVPGSEPERPRKRWRWLLWIAVGLALILAAVAWYMVAVSSHGGSTAQCIQFLMVFGGVVCCGVRYVSRGPRR